MNWKTIDNSLAKLGAYMATDVAMKKWGVRRMAGFSKAYNRIRYASRWNCHVAAFRQSRDILLQENALPGETFPKLRMQDGWCIDESQTLPHLEALLDQAETIVEQRKGCLHSGIQQPFLREMLFAEDMERCPAFFDFITSSSVLSVAMAYLQTVPVLSKTRPPGVRLMESHRDLDPQADGPPRESQLYHMDYYDSPMVYILVAVRDIGVDCGPWTFLPASVSERIARQTAYHEPGTAYRLSDETIRPLMQPGEEIVFACKRGTVLFIDSSRCMHFGSRDAFSPRFQMFFGLTSPCRRDLAETYLNPHKYPLPEKPSRLRQMVMQ